MLCHPDKGKKKKKRKPKPMAYRLPAQRQNEPLVSVKKPGKRRMVSWSLGCPCLPHHYNLISLCQTCLPTAFRQQFTLFPCLHFPASLPQASGPFLKPSCTETRHIFQENQALPEGNFSTSPPTSTVHSAPPTHVLLSLPPSPPLVRVFAAQKNH